MTPVLTTAIIIKELSFGVIMQQNVLNRSRLEANIPLLRGLDDKDKIQHNIVNIFNIHFGRSKEPSH